MSEWLRGTSPQNRAGLPRAPLRRLVWLVVLPAILLGCTGHGSLAALRDRAVVLPPSLEYLDEHRLGSRSCFFGDCPQLVTYYTVDQDPDETCTELEDALEASDLADLQRPDPDECHFTARIDDHRLIARVSGPRESLPPPPGSADPVPVGRDHRAFTTVTIVTSPGG